MATAAGCCCRLLLLHAMGLHVWHKFKLHAKLSSAGLAGQVRRPTDYNPATMAHLGPTQPSAAVNAGLLGLTALSAPVADGPNRLVVGGFPNSMTDTQVLRTQQPRAGCFKADSSALHVYPVPRGEHGCQGCPAGDVFKL